MAKTKKLLKILVDTGIDKRTVVSGIAEYYKPDELIGRQVILVANLKPVQLMGVMSHGMVLAAVMMARTPSSSSSRCLRKTLGS